MDNKGKALTSIVIFIIVLLVAGYAYTVLAEKYKPEDKIQQAGKNPAPDFSVFDSQGNAVKLSDFTGKLIILNFWASWCPPCRNEMPHFNEVYSEVKNEVVFLMVDLTDGQRETQAKGQEYAEKQGYDFPVYFDKKRQAAAAYDISSIPTTFLIARDGNIIKVYRGSIDKVTLQEAVNRLIRG
ncbi:MAG TPA: redoxin domain-containing protein [Desulfitobacteriaceae bacterium]|nr:redoxin domain-containing protein [Desulfitobacteriaceae bacterium]